MLPMQMNPNQPQRSCSDVITEWWDSLPFINKAIITGSVVLYIVNAFTQKFIYDAMVDIPSLTLNGFQLWRVLTAWMIHADVFQLIFCLISLVSESIRLEKLLGSLAFLFDVILKNLQIQIIFLLIMYLLHFPYPQLLKYPSSGLWDLVMVYITIRSATNPDQPTQFLCLPIVIKNKYYPFLIILLFSLISFMPFSLVAAMIVGYLETFLFNGMILRISRSRAIWLETKLLGCFKTRPDFLAADGLDSQYFANNPGSSAPNSNQGYIGGRGVPIGGSNSGVIPPQRPPQQPPQPRPPQKPLSKPSSSTPFEGKGTLIGGMVDNQAMDREDSGEALNDQKRQGKKYMSNEYVGFANEEDTNDQTKQGNQNESMGSTKEEETKDRQRQKKKKESDRDQNSLI